MKILKIKSGTLIIASDQVWVAQETYSHTVDYVGIITNNNGRLPYLLFFSETPPQNYTVAEEEQVLSEILTLYFDFYISDKLKDPMVQTKKKIGIRNQIIENTEFHMYQISEVSSLKEIDNGIGIIRR